MGEPTGFTGTNIIRTSRSGAADDVFDELADGQNVAVSPGNRARIRYNNVTKILERSEDGGAYLPLGGPPVNWDPALQIDEWNGTKNRWEKRIYVGDQWFVWNAYPADRVYHIYNSVIDLDGTLGLGDGIIVPGGPLYTNDPAGGGGVISCQNTLHGAMTVATGALLGDNRRIMSGSTAGPIYPYNVSEAPYMHIRFYFPGAWANCRIILGLFADVNNYIAMRADTAVDNNIYSVTRAPGGAGEETNNHGVMTAATWHEVFIIATATAVTFVYDGAAGVVHTLNIPVGNLSHYYFIQTLAVGAKTIWFGRDMILQDAP